MHWPQHIDMRPTVSAAAGGHRSLIPPQWSMLARARACRSFGTVLRQPGSRAAPLLAPVWVDARQRFSQQFLQLARASRSAGEKASRSHRHSPTVLDRKEKAASVTHYARCAFRLRCGWLWSGSKRLQAPSTARTNLRRVARTAVRKAAAGGRSALALLRAPPRARCTARPL